MKYSQILAAIDLSEENDRIIETAAQMARDSGATLHLMSVFRPLGQVYGGINMAMVADQTISFEKQAREQATAQLVELGGKYGVEPDNIHVCLGQPAAEIRRLAETLNADLVVMGTHGRHGVGLLLGSTASGVLHGVSCDVLALKLKKE